VSEALSPGVNLSVLTLGDGHVAPYLRSRCISVLQLAIEAPSDYQDAAMCSQTAGNILVPIQIKFLVSNGTEASVPGHLLALGDQKIGHCLVQVTAAVLWPPTATAECNVSLDGGWRVNNPQTDKAPDFSHV